MIVLYGLLFATIALVAYHWRNYLRAVRLCLRLRGPPALPLLGHALLLKRKDLLEHLPTDHLQRYGRCTRVWLGPMPHFVLTEPDDVQRVLSARRHPQKLWLYRLMSDYLGRGLLTSDAATWQRHRRLIQPAFTSRNCARIVAKYASAAERVVRRLGAKADGETAVNIGAEMNEFVLDVQHGLLYVHSSLIRINIRCLFLYNIRDDLWNVRHRDARRL